MADDHTTEVTVETRNDDVSSDTVLVAAALRDRRQVAVLYERYADRLYRYARARTGSVTVADDIVSDTMLAALEGLHGFDPERGAFAGWLFTIARRRIADRGRSRARFRRMIDRVRTQTPNQTTRTFWTQPSAARMRNWRRGCSPHSLSATASWCCCAIAPG